MNYATRERVQQIENERLEDVFVFYAVVAKGPLRNFVEVLEYIKKFLPDSRLIYQHKSLGYLRIEKAREEEDDG